MRSDGKLRVPQDAGRALSPRAPRVGHRESDLASLRRLYGPSLSNKSRAIIDAAIE
jgi:hypothetical protein